jgi:CheY-like chemotaxis protein
VKILLVEDDRYYSARLKELLEDHGFEVSCAGSVQDALAVSFTDVVAIVSDVMLPNDPVATGLTIEETRSGFLSGVALFRKLRKQGLTIPLILLSGADESGEAANWANSNQIPYISKDGGPFALLKVLNGLGLKGTPPPPRAFIVHGHDEAALGELKDYLQNTLHWQQPVILREQPNRGRTIIEKFEEAAERIDCVLVLLTPDDTGVNLSTDDERRRARQNVIFELGFFYAHMGRKSGRVIALRKGPIDLPTDIHGIIWIDVSQGIKAAGEDIRKEVAHILQL